MICSVDGSYMLHRARYTCTKNNDIYWQNFVSLFLKILLNTLEQFSPTKVYVYFDRGRSIHRLKILESYKGNRKKDPDSLEEQAYDKSREFLYKHLPMIGFITVLEDGVEADDFAYLVACENKLGVHISDDRDWFLNLFPGWHLFRSKANELVSWENFCEMVEDYKNPRLIYLLTKSIMGDKSDNIPGVRGLGLKTAKKFASKILYKEDLGNSARAKSIKDNMDIIRRNMNIMNPYWIVLDEEARNTLYESENRVLEILKPMVTWVNLSKELDSVTSELMLLYHNYNKIIRNIQQ